MVNLTIVKYLVKLPLEKKKIKKIKNHIKQPIKKKKKKKPKTKTKNP